METKPSSLSAQKAVLTGDEIRSIWIEHGLDDEAVEDFARAIESALLSKLRAPVAGERSTFETAYTQMLNDRSTPPTFAAFMRNPDGSYALPIVERAWAMWQARAALASAPVAGEARQLPTINVGGNERPQQWFTAKEVRQLLDGAPQASEADPLQGAADWLMRAFEPPLSASDLARQLVIGYNRATRLRDAALSAQPGAQTPTPSSTTTEARMSDQCKCSFAIRMTGDGCRYCQPQTYIDALEMQEKDYQEYTDGLVEQRDSAIKALRRARLALAAAASRMPEFDSDYQQVDSFISLHDTKKRG